jgi:hypothetical protein
MNGLECKALSQEFKLEEELLLNQVVMHEENLAQISSTKTRENIHKIILQKVCIQSTP